MAPQLDTNCPLVEIERKFFLTAGQQAALRNSLETLSEKELADTYWDAPGYPLTTRDWWLRQRNGQWELKVPWAQAQAGPAESFEEFEGDAAVIARLRKDGVALISVDGTSTEELLRNSSFAPFARLHTSRVSLRGRQGAAAEGVKPVNVDLDNVVFDPELAETDVMVDESQGFSFAVAELEVMAQPEKSEVSKATAALDCLVEELDLTDAPPAYSKLLEYLARFRPQHLGAMGDAGVLPLDCWDQLKATAAATAARTACV